MAETRTRRRVVATAVVLATGGWPGFAFAGPAAGAWSGIGNVDQISTKLFLVAILVAGVGLLGFVVERAMRPRRRRRAAVRPASWSPPQPR